ncbi:hypothetical protein BDN72DRAFT_554196 [Pluteus cervinus]|uniref:Uncharacterized protein n=1 Tax=Pluteus cervinus TaxID=181527 RepID=A0ACD3A2U4_9AGAR|nr:hypothetical protein BDN72DRAFT_554196 [Pluteus cervinus]
MVCFSFTFSSITRVLGCSQQVLGTLIEEFRLVLRSRIYSQRPVISVSLSFISTATWAMASSSSKVCSTFKSLSGRAVESLNSLDSGVIDQRFNVDLSGRTRTKGPKTCSTKPLGRSTLWFSSLVRLEKVLTVCMRP